MDDEFEIHKNKLTNKTYISPQVDDVVLGPIRIASKVIDSEGAHYEQVMQKIVLRRSPTGRVEIVAKFVEVDRQLSVVTIQQFNGNTGVPGKTHFSFVGSQISKLLAFFQNIAAVEFSDVGKLNITDADLRKLIVSKTQAKTLVDENPDVFAEVVRYALTKEDITALGYRKKQLESFQKLLHDRAYFDQAKSKKKILKDEALWQAFFEHNPWAFGYGLSYFYVTGFENRKLEQFVEGYDLLHRGKRADGVLRTRGIVSAMCFVEIKTHETDLLDSDYYRAGCWAPSKELAGAVAQLQGTVAAAMHNMYGLQKPKDDAGNPTGEDVFNFRPRAFIVVGSLTQFTSEHGVNDDKVRSFELYRNSLVGLEIMTFDELYQRSRFIVEMATPKDANEPVA